MVSNTKRRDVRKDIEIISGMYRGTCEGSRGMWREASMLKLCQDRSEDRWNEKRSHKNLDAKIARRMGSTSSL